MNQESILVIDRNEQPTDFLGDGWRLDEQDEHSVVLAEIDPSKIILHSAIQAGDNDYLLGEERLIRLKTTGYIRLDVAAFQSFWKNQHLIPEIWKDKIDGRIRFIHFEGSIFKSDERDSTYRYNICLYWHKGKWEWYCSGLSGHWCSNNLSAVLALKV